MESAISVVEPRIRALLSAYPQMPATVIAERVGWTGSISWFRERVRLIRQEYLPADRVDRLEHPPGRVMQCDLWFPPVKIPVGFGQQAMLPVLVMVAAFSRFIAAVMLPSRQTMDLVAGMWQLIAQSFTAVPHELWWDNEAGIGRRGRLTDPVTALIGTLGSRVVRLKPYDPESKGIVERTNRYLETSFLPGRSFDSPQDFNSQLGQWLPIGNSRRVRVLDGRTVDFLDTDRAQMLVQMKKLEDPQRRELGLPKATGPLARRIAERGSLEIQAYDAVCFPGLAAEWAKWDGQRPFVGADDGVAHGCR